MVISSDTQNQPALLCTSSTTDLLLVYFFFTFYLCPLSCYDWLVKYPQCFAKAVNSDASSIFQILVVLIDSSNTIYLRNGVFKLETIIQNVIF